MSRLIRVRYENGVFVPLQPLRGGADLQDGDLLEFFLPDPSVVYLCETDRQIALDSGRVVRIEQDWPDTSPDSSGLPAED